MALRAGLGRSERADPEAAGRAAVAQASAPLGRDRVRSVVVFATGPLVDQAVAVARGAATVVPQATVVSIGGAGVLHPELDAEGTPAVVALALDAPVQAALAKGENETSAFGATLAHRRARPIAVVGRGALTPAGVPRLAALLGASNVVGGGVDREASLAVARPDEPVAEGALVGLRIDGGLRMVSEVSAGVEFLGGPRVVDEVERGFVVKLSGRSPLEHLGRAVRDRHDRPHVLVALHRGEGRPLIRGIGGIDPGRGGLHLGDDVVPGDRVSFCAPNPTTARADLVSTLRRLQKRLCGGVPVAALLFDSVGRGARLFGKPGVDAKIVRRALGPDVPFIGLRTASELVPLGDSLGLAGHCASVALLFAPS